METVGGQQSSHDSTDFARSYQTAGLLTGHVPRCAVQHGGAGIPLLFLSLSIFFIVCGCTWLCLFVLDCMTACLFVCLSACLPVRLFVLFSNIDVFICACV